MMGPIEEVLARPASEIAPDDRALIEVAHRNSLRLLKLVNTLLEFSRIEAGRAQARFEPTDLAALTADLASGFRSACQRAGLLLIVDCLTLPEPVFVDRDMWEKMVLNLLSNALKFTFEGGITVSLRAEDGRAVLRVRDSGVGVPRAELPRLFERFHRIEGQPSRTHEGSGIGLALVQELVRLHTGTIAADAGEAGGTVFTVALRFGTAHLPAGQISAGRALTPASISAEAYFEEALRWLPRDDAALPKPSEYAVPGLAGRPRIVVADDNADMRAYVARLLESWCETEAVNDGAAALASIRARRPDLVLTDVMMPNLDGFDLLREIRAAPDLRDLPVILLSARAGEEARVEGLDAGADDYLTKPFSASELRARVRANLAMAAVRREATRAALERKAELETVPTAVWFTHDPQARHVTGNRRAAAMLRLPESANASLTAVEGEKPEHFRIFRDGAEVPPETLPIQLAARGEEVRDTEQEVRFDDGSAITILMHATPLRDPAGTVVGAVAAAIDITERKRTEEQRVLLINELNHRVKNTLATVQSIAAQTLRNTEVAKPVRASLEARLIALSDAHNVLTERNWHSAGLRDIAAQALEPFRGGAEDRVLIDGTDVLLAPKAALAIAMSLHELATNAAKYGALTDGAGRVEIAWTAEAGRLRLRWQERDGPPVAAPTRRGFGSRLLERSLATELGGAVMVDYDPGGLVCTIDASLERIAAQGPSTV
ncbi:MAG: response regulator, partial [Acetobacteraceae bacterium]